MAARKQNDESRRPGEQPNGQTPSAQAIAANRTTVSAARLSRGPVDAPGKRHRRPLPNEPVDIRMGEPRGKQVGQKSAKNRLRAR
jgi:hypothetical protein